MEGPDGVEGLESRETKPRRLCHMQEIFGRARMRNGILPRVLGIFFLMGIMVASMVVMCGEFGEGALLIH